MKSLRTWIEGLQRQGKLIFTAEQLENQFPDKSTKALVLDSLEWTYLANEKYDKVFRTEKPTHRYALKTGKSMKGHSSRNRWNIVENTPIEIDE